jgi:hypothetical protein
MEPARAAARRLVARGQIEITQRGVSGPIPDARPDSSPSRAVRKLKSLLRTEPALSTSSAAEVWHEQCDAQPQPFIMETK